MLTVKIEAESIEELADKLLAIGSRLSGGAQPVAEAPAKVTRKAKPAEEPKAETKPDENPKAEEPKAETKPTEEPKAEAGGTLDWDKDVAPVVLALVKEKGRDFVAKVLETFGVARAAQLPPERWQELLDALNDAA